MTKFSNAKKLTQNQWRSESEVFLFVLTHILSCDFTSALVLNTNCACCTGQAVMLCQLAATILLQTHFGSDFGFVYVNVLQYVLLYIQIFLILYRSIVLFTENVIVFQHSSAYMYQSDMYWVIVS